MAQALGRGGPAGQGARARPNRVFVSNLKFSTSWQELKDHMRGAGEVTRADIMQLPDGRSKGAGLVEYATADEALKAINELNNSDLGGRVIYVREDRDDPPPRAAGGRGDGGFGGRGGGRGGRGAPAAGGRGGAGGAMGGVECHKCGETGHIQRFCPQVLQLDDAAAIKCRHCGLPNHVAKDCRAIRQPGGPFSCFRCGGYGHQAAVCPTVGAHQRCHICKGLGHLAASCPNGHHPAP